MKIGVLREDGSIKKCFDEYVDGFIVSDNLRKTLLMPQDILYDLFNEKERKEFIFNVFKSLCLGGKLCQYEDSITPYLDMTKRIYKDLVCVIKDVETKRYKVASVVYKIINIENSLSPLFPISHPQNFCFLSVDPIRRVVNVWYHASDVFYQ
jgi:hypothetical protein